MLPLKAPKNVCFNKFFLNGKVPLQKPENVLDQALSFLSNPNCHDLGSNET